MKRPPPLLLAALLAASTLASAQPEPDAPANGGAVGLAQALNGETGTTTATYGRISRTAYTLVLDGELSLRDFERAFARAGNRVNPREMAELGTILQGRLPSPSTTTFTVSDEAKQRAVDMIVGAGLTDEGRAAIENDETFAGTPLPAKVKQVLMIARLNGAEAYDVTETDSDGEGRFTDYPSITPATENMAFDWTEVTPAALAADIADVRSQLRIAGTARIQSLSVTVGRYDVTTGGTGSISASYDEAYHPVSASSPMGFRHLLIQMEQDWIADQFTIDDLRKARSRSNDRWASNCAILADGSFHCLPAIRRHSATSGLILTNPALARGKRMLWNGHIRVRKGKVVYIGTSGRISRLAARGRYRFVNPVPLLEAWGFEMDPNLQVVSEHSSARYKADAKRAILHD